ncbi:hypothetical protein A8E62_05560 [Burkholderia cenocepacia]|uniref:DUF2169 domain-containing protein n=2 Tax=Burkholderia TaxID=32008 RepID=A0AAJ5T966_9BURK|nr:DUF2169 domain-containing protein [Burkholderia cenocepacia]MBR8290514.1 DUF2169 domain-containing protein [Burkholderia cenocepacia]ONU69311.1 hypothetical protein A8E62_05560 [Burkholderia cenocepacia]ONU94826.1 hypothetical protein A8E63_04725 [Burkholderia cenocepacia]VBB17431.1 hypothetical protein (DUF2169) [Burkholderia stabilis]
MMAAVENYSGLPHAWFPKVGDSGHTFDVLVVRGTFDLGANGVVPTRAARQVPVVDGDLYDEPRGADPMRAMLIQPGDRVLHKPQTDVFVTGHAHAPDGRPAGSWTAGIQVGDREVSLQLSGPRRFVKRLLGWRLTDATEVTEVPLSFERAFGGGYAITLDQSDAIVRIHKPDNPVGCGWLPDAKALDVLPAEERKIMAAAVAGVRELPAPQIEDPMAPVRSPFQQSPAFGSGPIAPWWAPRVHRQGTLDDDWFATRCPAVPDDFDSAYYQVAPASLTLSKHLQGGEQLRLTNLLPDSRYVSRLPGWTVMAVAAYADGSSNVAFPVIDTLSIDLDKGRLSLVWRCCFDRFNPVRSLVIGATDQPVARPPAGELVEDVA